MGFKLEYGGFDAFAATLRFKANDPKLRNVRGIVGYTAPYALRVHEDLEAFHKNGQAKFLEQPMRQYRNDLFRRVADSMKSGMPLRSAVLEALNILLAVSKNLVPVLTGYLRSSGVAKTYYD